MLGLLKTKHVLNTMFILKYSLADLNSGRNLEEQLKNERILDEPPCRASMKNSGNKRMITKKEKLKTQGEALQ